MPQYELLAIFPGKLTEGALEAHTREMTEALMGAGVEGVRKESSQKMYLAYPIGGEQSGIYVRFAFTAPSAGIPAIEGKLNLLRGVLRFMITDFTPLSITTMSRPEPMRLSRPPEAAARAPALTEEEIEKKVEAALAATEEQT